MKTSGILRILSILTAVVLLFCSCDKGILKKEFEPQNKFTLSMSAEKDKKQFSADITCNSYADIKISFTYPEELSGFSITATENGYDVNAFGVPDILNSDEINDASLLNVLIGSIRMAVFSNHDSFIEKASEITAELNVDSIPVTVCFTSDGYLSTISSEEIDFSAIFKKQG